MSNFLDGLKKKAIGGVAARVVKNSHDNAKGNAAKAWQFLDGHKTLIVAVMLAVQRARPDWSGWTYWDATAHALGWDSVAPAIDPEALFTFGLAAFALSHRAVKIYRELRAGIPVLDIGRSPLDQSVALVRVEVGTEPTVKVVSPVSTEAVSAPTETVIVEQQPAKVPHA